MRIPSTGSIALDLFLAAVILIAGLFILIKKESKWGMVVIAAALFWAFKLIMPFYNKP